MSSTNTRRPEGFDMRAAVTRSMLGWGVVAGPFYLIVGVVHALLRPGFDFGRHPLSLLTLGDTGWIQIANLILSGVMSVVAAIGLARVLTGPVRARWTGILVGAYGVSLVASGIFRPDPMDGFPEGTPAGQLTMSASGATHFAFGAVAFVTLGAAAIVCSGWFRSRGQGRAALGSLLAGVIVLAGFFGGAVAGVIALWITVVVGWAWLALVSIAAYRAAPHPLRNVH